MSLRQGTDTISPSPGKETADSGSCIIYNFTNWSMNLEVLFRFLFVRAIVMHGSRSSVDCFLLLELIYF